MPVVRVTYPSGALTPDRKRQLAASLTDIVLDAEVDTITEAGRMVTVIHFLEAGNFAGFFAMFLILFFVSGVGNASTFQMIPAIMRLEMDRLMPGTDIAARHQQAEKESAAIIGFTSAVAAFGAFFIPKSYGSSIVLTGGPQAALWCFFAFYLACIAITWVVYTRRGGLLRAVERGGLARAAAQPA